MVKVENYSNAYKEVYEILKNIPKEDLKKIPPIFMEMIEKNMNKEYQYAVNPNIDFLEEQEIMPETRTILAYIFLNYWATENQKEKINMKFKREIQEAEEQKRQLYDVDIFKNKRQNEEIIREKLEMVVYKKENIITRIFNIIKRFFSKN